MTCAYADKQHRPHIPECDGEVGWQVPDYWRGEALAKHGPHMLLCDGHAYWQAHVVHPFDHRVETIDGGRRWPG